MSTRVAQLLDEQERIRKARMAVGARLWQEGKAAEAEYEAEVTRLSVRFREIAHELDRLEPDWNGGKFYCPREYGWVPLPPCPEHT